MKEFIAKNVRKAAQPAIPIESPAQSVIQTLTTSMKENARKRGMDALIGKLMGDNASSVNMDIEWQMVGATNVLMN